jgi:hypothetical protein
MLFLANITTRKFGPMAAISSKPTDERKFPCEKKVNMGEEG